MNRMGEKKINIYFNVLDEVSLPILHRLRDLRLRLVKLWFSKEQNAESCFMRDKLFIEHDLIDNNIVCYSWYQPDETVKAEYQGLKHLMSRSIKDGTDFICIDSRKYPHNQIVLFQDALHLSEYPDRFVKIPCFCDEDSLMSYLTAQGIFRFSLENSRDFKKATGISPVQGTAVYRELKTGHYWYLDMLHKTHYEVFDSTGKIHLGEADLCGNLDATKQDTRKQPIL